MYACLHDFVSALDRAGELARVSARVSPVLEIAEIADRASKSQCAHPPSGAARVTDPRFFDRGGKALLFEDVDGSDFPLLINAWGSYRRMELALGCNEAGPGAEAGHTPGGFEALAAKIAELTKPEPPRSLKDLAVMARRFAPLLRIPPKRRRGSGPCQERVIQGDDVDLTRLPMMRCWPMDGDFKGLGYPAEVNAGIPGVESGPEWERVHRGRYVTLGGIHTVHADDRDHPTPPSHNIGMYRVQLLGRRRMAMHWHMHHDGARHWRSWKALGKPMPVAIALGGESVMPYAATAPLPPGISELLMAGFLNRGGIPLVRCKSVPLWVPANAEIVIEGFVSAEAGHIGFDPRTDGAIGPGGVFEGPFGDHTGFYSLPDRYPVLEVTAITHRKNAMYPSTIVGLPPQEDYYLGKATERLFLPLLRTLIPDIEDYDLPMFGAFHNCAFVKIRKQYPLHARRVMHAIWGAGQMSWTKSIFVVDHDVDVHDHQAVLRAASVNCHPNRDTERAWGPLDILDHAAPRLGAGVKMGYDCTRKIPGEQCGAPGEPLPAAAVGDEPGLSGVLAVPGVTAAAWHAGGWLLVGVRKESPGIGREAIERLRPAAPAGTRFLVVVDHRVDVRNADEALFHWCANSDASRDVSEWPGVLAFDATPKRPGDERNGQPVREWPPVLSMSEEISTLVTRRLRAGEYGAVLA